MIIVWGRWGKEGGGGVGQQQKRHASEKKWGKGKGKAMKNNLAERKVLLDTKNTCYFTLKLMRPFFDGIYCEECRKMAFPNL